MRRMLKILQLLWVYCLDWLVTLLVWPISVLRRGVIIRNAIRTRRAGMQTAVVTYTRPDDWKRVVLVGTMHVADREYFEELNDLIDAEERDVDSTILYERVRKNEEPLPDGDRSPAALLERAFGGLHGLYRYMAAATGRAMQMDVLCPRDSWINTDLTGREVARRSAETWVVQYLSMTGVLDRVAKIARPKGGIPKPPQQPYFVASYQSEVSMRAMHLSVPLQALLLLLPKQATPIHTILTERNEVAAEGIMKALTDSDNVVSIWGAAHLPGIGKLLKRHGFVLSRKHVKWFTCCRFRRYGLWDIVKYAFTGRFRTE